MKRSISRTEITLFVTMLAFATLGATPLPTPPASVLADLSAHHCGAVNAVTGHFFTAKSVDWAAKCADKNGAQVRIYPSGMVKGMVVNSSIGLNVSTAYVISVISPQAVRKRFMQLSFDDQMPTWGHPWHEGIRVVDGANKLTVYCQDTGCSAVADDND